MIVIAAIVKQQGRHTEAAVAVTTMTKTATSSAPRSAPRRPMVGLAAFAGGKRNDYAKRRAEVARHQKFYKKAAQLREYRRKYGKSAAIADALDDNAAHGGSPGAHPHVEADEAATGRSKKARARATAPPDGSWTCGACGNVNWPTRSHCNTKTCGLERAAAEAADPAESVLGKAPAGRPGTPAAASRAGAPGGTRRKAPPANADRFAKEKRRAKEAREAAEKAAVERAAAQRAKEASVKRRKKANKTISQRDHRGRPLVRNTIARVLEKLS